MTLMGSCDPPKDKHSEIYQSLKEGKNRKTTTKTKFVILKLAFTKLQQELLQSGELSYRVCRQVMFFFSFIFI